MVAADTGVARALTRPCPPPQHLHIAGGDCSLVGAESGLSAAAMGDGTPPWVVVGGGIAGVCCAEELCRQRPGDRVTLISTDPVFRVRRTARGWLSSFHACAHAPWRNRLALAGRRESNPPVQPC